MARMSTWLGYMYVRGASRNCHCTYDEEDFYYINGRAAQERALKGVRLAVLVSWRGHAMRIYEGAIAGVRCPDAPDGAFTEMQFEHAFLPAVSPVNLLPKTSACGIWSTRCPGSV